MKIKDQSIETLRGLAIILVVAGYIIRGDLNHLPPSKISSGLDFLYYLLKPVRLPLFTVISAYLYAASPATKETFKKLVHGKARRIMIPFIAVSALQYLFYAFVPVKGPHPLADLYKVYLFPLEQFWFLYSIFWIFMIVGFMDAKGWLDTRIKWAGWLAAACVLHFAFEPTDLFSINGVNFLMPFFLLGYGFQRYAKDIFTPKMIMVYALIAGCVYGVYAHFYVHWVKDGHYLYKGLGLAISLTAVPLLFHFRPTVPLLAAVGYYAFGIHIFNKISSAMPKLAFSYLHIDNPVAVFITYLTCGVVFSIMIQIFLERFAWSRQYILGMKEASKPAVSVSGSVPKEASVTVGANP